MYTAAVAVVDDAEVVRLLLLKRMQALGLTAVACSDGAELIARIRRGELFRLIMMDKSMPVMGGEEASAEVRRMGILSSVTAIIGLTGEADPVSLLRFQQSGCDAVFQKPLLPVDFYEIVHRYLGPFLAQADLRAAVRGRSGKAISHAAAATDPAETIRVHELDGTVPAPIKVQEPSEINDVGLIVSITEAIATLDRFKRHAATESVRIMAPFFEALQYIFEESNAAAGGAGGGASGQAARSVGRGGGSLSLAAAPSSTPPMVEPLAWYGESSEDHSRGGGMDVDMSASGDGDLSAFLGDFIDTMEDSGTDGIPVDNGTRQAQVSHLGAVDGALWH